MQFGILRVFNDDTLSPGAIWPLHPHRNIEVVTYCAEGEFLHEDEHGKGNILRKGWVQHTTVGRGMYHSEINNRKDMPMRFIQMWFIPSTPDLDPSVQFKQVERSDRTNRILTLVSPRDPDALPIASDARVMSSFLQKGHTVDVHPDPERGMYLYVVEGGPVLVNGDEVPPLGAAQIVGEHRLEISAHEDAELLLVDVHIPQ